jgi:pimeloyl-ACP methyl ester carboxylesterase
VGVPVTECVAVAPGVELHARRWSGDDEVPFLLVHGLASNARTWDGVAGRLRELGHPVTSVDLRGHGLSAKPDDGYDFTSLARDLVLVLDHLGWETAVVAGQSTGGNLAVDLASRAPTRVAGAVGVDGGFIELRARWPRWEECERALAPPALEGTPASRVAAAIRVAHRDWSAEAIEATLANLEVLADGTVRPWLTRGRHLRILRALWEHSPSEVLATLEVPVLLVPADSGDDWSRVKRAEIDRAVAAGRDVRVHWFSPADHDVHVQHPIELGNVLHEWALLMAVGADRKRGL